MLLLSADAKLLDDLIADDCTLLDDNEINPTTSTKAKLLDQVRRAEQLGIKRPEVSIEIVRLNVQHDGNNIIVIGDAISHRRESEYGGHFTYTYADRQAHLRLTCAKFKPQ